MGTTNLMTASRQWATRPADERFWGLNDLGNALDESREKSHEKETPTRQISVAANGSDLALLVPGGHAEMTHWSFNQLCTYASAPASYLRELPADLAAQNLNHGLKKRATDDARTNLLLHRKSAGNMTIRSVTTDHYGRLWNSDIVRSLIPNMGSGWMVPPARPSGHDDDRARPATIRDIVPNQKDFALAVKVGDMIAPAGVYASDRDMFIFLVNPERIIDDGVNGLMRGVFIWNSEVGAGAFKIQAFYLENVCSNHIVWGAENVRTVKIVHKKGAIQQMGYKMRNQLSSFSHRDTSAETKMIRAARSHYFGKNKEETVKAIYANRSIGLTQTEIELAYDTAERWEHTALAPPTSAWGICHGATRMSQLCHHADSRAKIDRAAGRILEIAAKSHGVDTRQLALPSPN